MPNFATPTPNSSNLNAFVSQQHFHSGQTSWPLHPTSNVETVARALDASLSAPNHVFNGVRRNIIEEDISPGGETGSLTGCQLVSPPSPMLSDAINFTPSSICVSDDDIEQRSNGRGSHLKRVRSISQSTSTVSSTWGDSEDDGYSDYVEQGDLRNKNTSGGVNIEEPIDSQPANKSAYIK
jgi:hypothetical protein